MSRRSIIRGCDGIVEIDEASRSVVKTYLHSDHDTAIRNARREVAYASRFSDALAGLPDVACPKVISWECSVPPRVVMELCPGRGLSDFLLLTAAPGIHVESIAGRIRLGLEIYTDLFAEPYYDFCFNNMLFDEDSGTLTFLDFLSPAQPVDTGLDEPVEASLGRLVGSACYTLARPAFLFSEKTAYVNLMRSVVTGFGRKVREDRIYAGAQRVFARICGAGGGLRRSYYRTIGSYVADGCLRRLRQSTAPARSVPLFRGD